MEVREFERSGQSRKLAKPPVATIGFLKRKRLQAAGPKAWWKTVIHFVPKPWRPARYVQDTSILRG